MKVGISMSETSGCAVALFEGGPERGVTVLGP
jgi:hypothetical protein